MLDKGFKGKKKFDFKKWITGGNSKLYLGLIIVVFLFLMISLRTVIRMHEENIRDEVESSTEAVTEDITQEESQDSNYVANNLVYCIKINNQENFAIIYKMDDNNEYTIPVKAFSVSVNEDTPLGETFISKKSLWWKVSDVSFCRYASKLDNSEVLYSASYFYNDTPNSLNKNSYNNIGNPSIDGSIHMTVANARWIYENCGINTPVYISDDLQLDEGLELEQFNKVSSGYVDPTDEKSNSRK